MTRLLGFVRVAQNCQWIGLHRLWSVGYNHALPPGLRMFCKLQELFETMELEHFWSRFLKNAWSL